MTFRVIYSSDSLDDLRAIYSYIAYEKLAPENAEGQVNRIRKAIRGLYLYAAPRLLCAVICFLRP